MAQMRFLLPRRDALPEGAIERAYLCGMEGIPWRSHNYWQGDQLVLERPVHESANLNFLWPVDGYGEVALCTASLMERARPYILPLELARGSLNRLRNRMFAAQAAGYQLPAELLRRVHESMQLFLRAATRQHQVSESAALADQALALTLPAMDHLIQELARQALAWRHQQEKVQLGTLLGGRLAGGPLNPQIGERFLAAFNSAVVPTCWRSIEEVDGQFRWDETDEQVQWCRQHGLRVCAGPLLQLDPRSLPDWLYLWDDDFRQLHACICRFVERTVQKYRGVVHAWHAAARINTSRCLNLTEEQKLRLTVSVVETIRRHDPHTPLVVSFDQPWAEYMSGDDTQLSPLHFADALVRADLGIAGLGVELNLGFAHGSLPRDLLQIEARVDQWSGLGVPLFVLLTSPSCSQADPLAQFQPRSRSVGSANGHSPRSQSDYAGHLVPVLLAKPAVQGVFWNQTRDAIPHEFACGGLFTPDDQPKPILDTLARIRAEHLV